MEAMVALGITFLIIGCVILGVAFILDVLF